MSFFDDEHGRVVAVVWFRGCTKPSILLPVDEPACKDEESPADYNAGGYLPVKVNDTFKQGRYRVVRKLGSVFYIFPAKCYCS